MEFLVSCLLRYVLRSWIAFKVATYIRKKMINRYAVDENFRQSVIRPHDIDWRNIKWFAVFSSYSYKDNKAIRKKYESFSNVYIHEINNIKYIVLSDTSNKTYYISIRGTYNSDNAVRDISFSKDKSFRLGMYLHRKFHRSAELIADDLLTRLDKSYSIYITGHSLGAAEALIVSWYLDYSNFNVAECITFGQPKVTDSIGTRKMRGKINLIRIVNETDIVPLLPPEGTHRNRYAHSGNMIKLLGDGKFCYLEEPDSLNHSINSFWLCNAEDVFSFYRTKSSLPNHYITSYITNIDGILRDGTELSWDERVEYLSTQEIQNIA